MTRPPGSSPPLWVLLLLLVAPALPACPTGTHRPGSTEERVRSDAHDAMHADLVMPPDDLTDEQDDTAAEHATPCRFPLDDWRRAAVRVNHELPPDEDTYLRTRTVSAEHGPGRVAISWEIRDREGLERGTDTWLCDDERLLLERIDAETITLRFIPPLPVISPDTAEPETTEGTVLILRGERHSSSTYTFTIERSQGEPHARLADHAHRWLHTRSHLTFDLEESVHWEADTLWAIGDELFVSARRTQRITLGDASGERREEARLVFR